MAIDGPYPSLGQGKNIKVIIFSVTYLPIIQYIRWLKSPISKHTTNGQSPAFESALTVNIDLSLDTAGNSQALLSLLLTQSERTTQEVSEYTRNPRWRSDICLD